MAKYKDDKNYSEEKNHLEDAKAIRKAAYELSLLGKQSKDVLDHRDEFRKFFAKIKDKLKLKREMEDIIWLHLKATNNDKKELFENGIKNFGYKL